LMNIDPISVPLVAANHPSPALGGWNFKYSHIIAILEYNLSTLWEIMPQIYV
jgi:hypothetical protein